MRDLRIYLHALKNKSKMRIGRLRPSTLQSILKSLVDGGGLDGNENDPFPKVCKQCMPQSSDSPLFRLVTVLHSPNVPDDPTSAGIDQSIDGINQSGGNRMNTGGTADVSRRQRWLQQARRGNGGSDVILTASDTITGTNITESIFTGPFSHHVSSNNVTEGNTNSSNILQSIPENYTSSNTNQTRRAASLPELLMAQQRVIGNASASNETQRYRNYRHQRSGRPLFDVIERQASPSAERKGDSDGMDITHDSTSSFSDPSDSKDKGKVFPAPENEGEVVIISGAVTQPSYQTQDTATMKPNEGNASKTTPLNTIKESLSSATEANNSSAADRVNDQQKSQQRILSRLSSVASISIPSLIILEGQGTTNRNSNDKAEHTIDVNLHSNIESPKEPVQLTSDLPKSQASQEKVQETSKHDGSSPDSPKEKRNVRTERWQDDYNHIDTDWSMQAMDVLYNASFYDYVRDERNVDLSAIRLSRLVREYKPVQVAMGIRWLVQGWSVESTAKLLRIIFDDWLPDLAGCVFALLSKEWPLKPQLGLCVAYLMLSEPPASAALFMRSLSTFWSETAMVELIGYLDSLLEWQKDYFREFITVYTNLMYDLTSSNESVNSNRTASLGALRGSMSWGKESSLTSSTVNLSADTATENVKRNNSEASLNKNDDGAKSTKTDDQPIFARQPSSSSNADRFVQSRASNELTSTAYKLVNGTSFY